MEKLEPGKTYPVDLELKDYSKQICSRTYPVPKVHEKMFKEEVGSLVILGVSEVANDLEWGSPSFAQPKPKSNKVRFPSDFRNLNK